MGKKKEQKNATPKATRQKTSVTEEQALTWMREQGDKEITSTAIRDAFGFPSRAPARRIMKSLAKAGKVQIIEHSTGKGKRETYTYKVAA